MTKSNLIRSLVLMCLLTAFFTCTKNNEVPTPVVDQASLAALVAQYNALAVQVYGAQQTTTADSLSASSAAASVASASWNLTQLQDSIAALTAALNSKVSYSVMVQSFTGYPLPGATVEVSQGGNIIQATSGPNGIATFSNPLYAGYVIGTVDLKGFARLIFRADIRNGSDEATTYSVVSAVSMLPTGGTGLSDSAMTKFTFKAYANYSILNDTAGGANYGYTAPGLPLGASGDNIQWDAVTTQPLTVTADRTLFQTYYGYNSDCECYQWISAAIPPSPYFSGGSKNGAVLNVGFENAKWTQAAADANGNYTLMLPMLSNQNSLVLGSGGSFRFNFVVTMGTFVHDYTRYDLCDCPEVVRTGKSAPPSYAISMTFRLEDCQTSDCTYYWQARTKDNSSTSVILPLFLNAFPN